MFKVIFTYVDGTYGSRAGLTSKEAAESSARGWTKTLIAERNRALRNRKPLEGCRPLVKSWEVVEYGGQLSLLDEEDIFIVWNSDDEIVTVTRESEARRLYLENEGYYIHR